VDRLGAEGLEMGPFTEDPSQPRHLPGRREVSGRAARPNEPVRERQLGPAQTLGVQG
jgi:hypothetical protein